MFVVDASALAKSFLDEPRASEFRQWLEKAVERGEELIVPHLAFSEMGRIIQKERGDLSAEQSKELYEAVFLGINTRPVEPGYFRAWDFASKGLTFYDAEYVELADLIGATLVSADRDQLAAAALRKIGTLSFAPDPAGERGRPRPTRP